MALQRPKINTNWLLLGVAIALGIGAVVLSNHLIQRRMAQLEEEAHKGQQTVNVVVANTPEQFERFIADETRKWASVVKETGVTAG